MTVPGISRDQLRCFFEGEINRIESLETPPSDYIQTLHLIHEAIEALDALDCGEVRPVFERADNSAHGTQPFLVHQLRIGALKHVAVLREIGWTAAEAIEEVRGAYGVSDETIKKWWKKIGKSGKSEDVMEARALFRGWKMLGFPFSEAALLSKIKKDGPAFIAQFKAQAKKTGMKS